MRLAFVLPHAAASLIEPPPPGEATWLVEATLPNEAPPPVSARLPASAPALRAAQALVLMLAVRPVPLAERVLAPPAPLPALEMPAEP